MKIEEEVRDKIKFYFLSGNRKFKSLVKIVSHYKHEDLTENFSYDALRGIALQTPYKDISHNFQITPMSDGKALLSKTMILKSEQTETKASTIIQFMKHESAKLVSG